MSRYPRGSEWRKWDLHIHSTYSQESRAKLSPQKIFEAASENNISVISITDHSNVDGLDEAWNVWSNGTDSNGKKFSDIIIFFPGVELKANAGKRGVHFLAIFPPETQIKGYSQKVDQKFLKESFLSKIGCSDSDIKGYGSGDYKKGLFAAAVDFKQTAELVRELGGVIIVHHGNKDHALENEIAHPHNASPDELLNTLGNQKTDLMRGCVDICELPNWSSYHQKQQKFYLKTFNKPSVVFSDSHESYECPCPTWIKADPTFEGLRQVLNEPNDRISVYNPPAILEHVRKNRPFYIHSISITPKENEKGWFNNNKVPLNQNLVAVIGNKGTGKSALADIISLLGNTKQFDKFSFLGPKKFRDTKTGKAKQFQAEMSWLDSNTSGPMTLEKNPEAGSVERVKYLPQDFINDICTDLSSSQNSKFYKELQSVIFSHLKEHERLNYNSLAELLEQETEETEKRIKSRIDNITRMNDEIVKLQQQLKPEAKLELQNKLCEKKRFVEQILASKPSKPSTKYIRPEKNQKQKALLTALQKLKEREVHLNGLRDSFAKKRVLINGKISTVRKLSERLIWIKEEAQKFRKEVSDLSDSIGINTDELLQIKIDKILLEKKAKEFQANLEGLNKLLGDHETEFSLMWELVPLQKRIQQYQKDLDKPEKEYQNYLQRRKEWKRQFIEAVGQKSNPERDTLRRFQQELSMIEELPQHIEELTKKRKDYTKKIYQLKTKLKEKLCHFHTPVQQFISEHPIAQQEQFPLSFQVSTSEENFSDFFFKYINQGRNGSFCGAESGRQRLADIINQTDFDNEEDVLAFLDNIMSALQEDLRSSSTQKLSIEAQLKKNMTESDFLNNLFSLTYLKPRYNLRWDGKQVDQLSPGERGQLLLIFYLLIDQNQTPIIIDQPEENLDNQTVYKVLVPCIKEAKEKRQVILVTHNPNLAVVCDAEQIIHAQMDKKDKNLIKYTTGAIENPSINQKIVDVLEGTEPAFTVRKSKYQFG
ncbi:MAG: PHP domain-containing protein [Candidatus Electrothrix sp. AX1]|nr:PHP domain-containing protein [Candidatus Electrothrix sp. AX1]